MPYVRSLPACIALVAAVACTTMPSSASRSPEAAMTAVTAAAVRHGGHTITARAAVSMASPGAKVRVSGHISGHAGRAFRLVRRTSSGWVVVAQGRTTKAHSYTTSLTARSGSSTSYRVEAPAQGATPRSTSAPFVVARRGDQGSQGTADMYALLTSPGDRWDPCTTIGWKFNPTGGYAGSLDDVSRAFAAVSAASGLSFRYDGVSDRVAVRDAIDADTQILVSWADPSQVPGLAGAVVGLGGPQWVSQAADAGPVEFTGGSIALDRTNDLLPGYTASGDSTWGQVMEHEISHVVGLGHYDDRTQVMNPSVEGSNHSFGAGDLEGLRVLGAAAGCFPAPAPAPAASTPARTAPTPAGDPLSLLAG